MLSQAARLLERDRNTNLYVQLQAVEVCGSRPSTTEDLCTGSGREPTESPVFPHRQSRTITLFNDFCNKSCILCMQTRVLPVRTIQYPLSRGLWLENFLFAFEAMSYATKVYAFDLFSLRFQTNACGECLNRGLCALPVLGNQAMSCRSRSLPTSS